MPSTSHHTGADTAAPAEAHGVRYFAETNTVTSAGPTPTPPTQTGMTEVEALLQRLLPGTPVMASWAQPGPARRDWNTIVCFSCANRATG